MRTLETTVYTFDELSDTANDQSPRLVPGHQVRQTLANSMQSLC